MGLVGGWSLSLLNIGTYTPVALDAVVTVSSLFYGVMCGIALGELAAVLPSISVVRKDILTALRA